MTNPEDMKAKIELARQNAVERSAGKLRLQFNSKGQSIPNSWTELATKLGLSAADIPALKILVASRGLKGPRR